MGRHLKKKFPKYSVIKIIHAIILTEKSAT